MISRIVHFTDSTGFGGADQALVQGRAHLERDAWGSALMYHATPGIAPLAAQAHRLSIPLRTVPAMPDGLGGLRRLPGFVRDLRQMRPAIFHAHLTWPLAAKWALAGAIIARVPSIVATEQLWMDLPYTAWVRGQQRVLALGMTRYIAVSRHVARRRQATFGVPAQKLTVIYNAVDLGRFERSCSPALREQWTGGIARPIVLTCARLDVQKGQRYLLDAAAQVPDALFVLAGDGPDRAGLEAYAKERGISERVLFLGRRGDIPELLANCDVFVLPSLFEGFPLSILEAMAAGKPVIATKIGGTDEAVVDGMTGILVPPRDGAALAQAIRQLLAAPRLADRFGHAGRLRVQQAFSARRMAEQVDALYRQLVSR
jgi:glycosyltransferase involved in cell wall biosynthesis